MDRCVKIVFLDNGKINTDFSNCSISDITMAKEYLQHVIKIYMQQYVKEDNNNAD